VAYSGTYDGTLGRHANSVTSALHLVPPLALARLRATLHAIISGVPVKETLDDAEQSLRGAQIQVPRLIRLRCEDLAPREQRERPKTPARPSDPFLRIRPTIQARTS
jgi:hypothetical protein